MASRVVAMIPAFCNSLRKPGEIPLLASPGAPAGTTDVPVLSAVAVFSPIKLVGRGLRNRRRQRMKGTKRSTGFHDTLHLVPVAKLFAILADFASERGKLVRGSAEYCGGIGNGFHNAKSVDFHSGQCLRNFRQPLGGSAWVPLDCPNAE